MHGERYLEDLLQVVVARAIAVQGEQPIQRRSVNFPGLSFLRPEKQATKAAEDVLKRLHGATRGDVAALVRHVQDLQGHVAALEGLSADESSSSV